MLPSELHRVAAVLQAQLKDGLAHAFGDALGNHIREPLQGFIVGPEKQVLERYPRGRVVEIQVVKELVQLLMVMIRRSGARGRVGASLSRAREAEILLLLNVFGKVA